MENKVPDKNNELSQVTGENCPTSTDILSIITEIEMGYSVVWFINVTVKPALVTTSIKQ